jgi:two-component system, response regulator, stage 0 sporulation protein F
MYYVENTNAMLKENHQNSPNIIQHRDNINIMVLIIEDDRYMNETLTEVLEDEGYNVESCLTVLNAINKIKHNDKIYHLIIADYNLQFFTGVNGLDIFELAKDKNPYVKGIMISAYGDRKIREKASQKGIEVFFDKPFQINELIDAVNRINDEISHDSKYIFLN